MSGLRVALCADFPEELWPSMDRVATEIVAHVRRHHAETIDMTAVCPPFTRRATRFWRARTAFSIDRALNRWWDYPRHARAFAGDHDVFHLVDHSYAHLVHRLPAERTVVTCHDLDTFRSLLRPEAEPRSAAFRLATRRILTGLQRAGRIACVTAAVRDELLAFGLVPPERVTVVSNGVSDSFSPDADGAADRAAARLVAPRADAVEILHVGSTIPRKGVDTLLDVCAALVPHTPGLHLVRVGGPFTSAQQQRLVDLGLAGRVTVVGFVTERTLAAIYRRAALVLQPSEREGFGLPLVEAMASGTPVVASDLPVLREVGGDAVTFCPVGDVAVWARTVGALLEQRRRDDRLWLARRQAGCARARLFSWSHVASRMTDIYQELGSTRLRALAS